MTLKQIYQMIASVGVPVAYYQFTEATAKPTPFICYYYPGNADFIADNVNYAGINELVIELYTDNKDFTLEASLEAVLTANEIPFGKTENYIDTEKMYMITYNTEVIINAEQ